MSSTTSLNKLGVAVRARYLALTIAHKLSLIAFILANIALGVSLLIIGPSRIAQTLYDASQRLGQHPLGWLVLTVLLIVMSFPPLVGYSTCVSLCGFTYGLKGFFVAAPAAVVGSALAFLALRKLFSRRLRVWTSKNEKWQALEHVVRSKGLPLIVLIRFSPFPPWVYSNALFASIEPVKLWQFVVATICTLPKILLAVFVGARIAEFSDGDKRGHMDTKTKILNATSVVIGLLIGFGTGAFIYRQMQRQIQTLREEGEEGALAANALEDAEEGAPLLSGYSSD